MVTAVEEFDDTLQDGGCGHGRGRGSVSGDHHHIGKKVHRTPGESWMVHGPTEYFPPIEVGTPEKR